MFASTIQSIAFNAKNIPVLTSKDQTYSYNTIRKSHGIFTAFQKAYDTVLKIKDELNLIYNHRLQLLPRDIQEIYNKHIFFCRDVLKYNSDQQMFKDCDKDMNGKLCEQQQMYIFTRVLQKIYEKKEEEIKNQNYNRFSLLLGEIKKIQKELPQIQLQIRNKILETKKSIGLIKKQLKLQQYKNQIKKNQEQFFQEKKTKLQDLKKRHNQQFQKLEQTLELKNPSFIYKTRPSILLRQAKDKHLLHKLAPYKSQKKRQYQCELLRDNIVTHINEQEKRINKTIQVKKIYERKLLQKEHSDEQEIINEKFNRKYKKLLANISNRKEQIEKSENSKIMNLLNKDKKQANNRIDWISKAIRVARQRKDSNNVAQILVAHKDIAVHNNTIEQLSILQLSDRQKRNFRYFGSREIQANHIHLNKTIQLRTLTPTPKNDLFYALRPGKHEIDLLYQQSEGIQHQRSLTDLYDQSLNLKKV